MRRVVRFAWGIASLGLLAGSAAGVELRVVSLNASNAGSQTAGPRAGMDLILSAVGSAVSDDPLLPGNSGVARPIDILCLQESRSSALTAVPYANLLNTIYGTDRYAAGTLDGATTGTGTQVVVYNRQTVQLLGMTAVGTASTAGMPRQALRYQFRPAGLISAEADVFIYNLHAKAGNTATDRDRRLVEAQTVRADADALGPGRNLIVLGDFNVYRDSEPMYQHLLSAGNGRVVDPIAAPGVWSGNEAFRAVHTQSPWDSALATQTGFNGSGGGMDDRFDQQLSSPAIMTGDAGLRYVVNSYFAFGNNGTHALDRPITTGSGASHDVLKAMAGILDHLPVVADYRLAPRLGLAHPGDANLDLTTNLADFAIVAGRFNRPADWFAGDFNADGTTGIADFSILAANFNTSAAPARPAAIPEPTTTITLAAACLALLARRRTGLAMA